MSQTLFAPAPAGAVRPQRPAAAGGVLPSVVAPALLVLAALAGVWTLVAGPLVARLVNHFHISYAVAGAICTLIANGSFWTIAWLYPFVVPVEITLATFLKVLGTGYVIGY